MQIDKCNITKYYFVSFIPFLILCLITLKVSAGVYQCIGPSGIVEYRDKPCDSISEAKQFLPIQYHKTHEKQLKKQAKELQEAHLALKHQEKQTLKFHKETLKEIKREQKQIERRQNQCMRLNQKIQHIESQLRAGCKARKIHYLKEQLSDLEGMKQNLCMDES